MSNDIIASLKNELSTVVTGVDEDTRAVAGGGGGQRRISIKGGVFRKFAGGKELGTIEDRFMNVIFVRMAHAACRKYYAGAYKEGERVNPTCWSSDGKTPDANVKTPQSANCKDCQFSVKGSGQGGTGAACRLSWHTAVVLPRDPAGDVMQLVLPATSCFGEEDSGRWPFRPYVQMLAANNISAGRVVTKMQFDTKSPVPKLLFSPIAAVPADMADVIVKQRDSTAAEAAIKISVYQGPATSTNNDDTQVAEPQLRDAPAKPAAATADVADVVKKWAKK
jgi:hypothetical protein